MYPPKDTSNINLTNENAGYKSSASIDIASLLIYPESKIEPLEIISPPDDSSAADSKNTGENKNEKYSYPSSFLSSITFNWVFDVVKNRSNDKPIKLSNLGNISPSLQSEKFFNQIQPIWDYKYFEISRNNLKNNVSVNHSFLPLFMTLIKSNFKKIIVILTLIFIYSIWDFFSVIIFKEIILLFGDEDSDEIEDKRNLLLKHLTLKQLISLMIINKTSCILIFRQLKFLCEELNYCTTSQLNLLIFDKLLKIPTYNKNFFNEGQLANLIQSDSGKFGILISNATLVLGIPFNFICGNYLLFSFFGWAYVPGFFMLCFLLLLYYALGGKEEKYQKEKMKATDSRLNIISQTLDIIKMIKFYCWENIFKKKINEKRENELKIDSEQKNFHELIYTVCYASESILFFMCVACYNLFYNKLDPAKLFTALYLVQGLIQSLFFNSFFVLLYEAIISLSRIDKFLNYKNFDFSQVKYFSSKSPYAIRISNSDFGINNSVSYNNDDKNNFDDRKKNNLSVYNNLFLNNVNPNYIISKKSILEYEDTNYLSEINDINSNNMKKKLILSKSNLSSIYKNKNESTSCEVGLGGDKTVLLRNISLVIKKKEHIGIIGEVGSGKTCLLNAFINNLENLNKGEVLLPNKVSFVSQNPWILNATIEENIVLFNKKDTEKYKKVISACQLEVDLMNFPNGDKTEIGEKGINLSGGQKVRISIARAIYNDADVYIFDDPLSALDAYVGKSLFKEVFNGYLKDKTVIVSTHALQYLSHFDRIFYINNGTIEFSGIYSELIDEPFYLSIVKHEEERNSNYSTNATEKNRSTVDRYNFCLESMRKINLKKNFEEDVNDNKETTWPAFLTFVNFAGGLLIVFKLISANLLWKGTQIYSNYYLTIWSGIKHIKEEKNTRCFIIFSLLSLPSVIFIYFRQQFRLQGFLNYSRKMHETLINCIINAPINLFHDITPKGHIISRVGKDLENGSLLSKYINSLLTYSFQLIGSIVICVCFNIWTLPVIFFILIIEISFTFYCMYPIRDISRLEGVYRTPVYRAFTETVNGLHIIRALNNEKQFTEKFRDKLNDYVKICLYNSGISAWYNVHLDIISCVLLIFILISCCFYKENYNTPSMGLLLTYSFAAINCLFILMKKICDIGTLLVSVQRCYNYTKIPQENFPTLPSDIKYKDKSLFTNGKINFVNFSAKYRPNNPLALNNLTFEIMPCEKIGVVGRTGSGKSTISLCIFRLLEANSGNIYIDNININQIGLELLRNNLTIIPQEPTIIEGTLRENIDPFGTKTDLLINEAIKEVGLDDFMSDKNLDYMINENGSNISIGEKQLICIARALLRKRKIIIMDEAMANIDYITENILQKNIDKIMKDCTVITIAHRIKTVINYDKILVLNNGEMVEFDSPQNLIAKKGLFYQLYKESMIK